MFHQLSLRFDDPKWYREQAWVSFAEYEARRSRNIAEHGAENVDAPTLGEMRRNYLYGETYRDLQKLGMREPDARKIVTENFARSQSFVFTTQALDAKSDRAFLVLSGKSRAGKTFGVLAAFFLHDFVANPVVIRAINLPSALRPTSFSQKPWDPTRVPSLLVDDLGCEEEAPNKMATVLEELLDARQNASRFFTVFTTNLALDVFGKRYGERVLNRLNQFGRGVTVTDGPFVALDGGFA